MSLTKAEQVLKILAGVTATIAVLTASWVWIITVKRQNQLAMEIVAAASTPTPAPVIAQEATPVATATPAAAETPVEHVTPKAVAEENQMKSPAALNNGNLAFRHPATCSASQNDHPAGNAVDGNSNTVWTASSAAPGAWLQVDLGAPIGIKSCEIEWEQESKYYEYTLAGSLDGQTWSKLADQTTAVPASPGSPSHLSRINLPFQQTRYIRVTVTGGLNQNRWPSIRELRVFNEYPGIIAPVPMGATQPVAPVPMGAPQPETAPSIVPASPDTVDMAVLAATPADWPKTVTIKQAGVVFPVIINGKPSGEIQAPPGIQVTLVKVTPDQLTVSFQGAVQVVPVNATDLIERVQSSRRH